MRKALVVGVFGLGLLGGCMQSSPQLFYLKTGSVGQEHNRILLKCEVEAAQQVPVNNQTSTTPVFTTPTYTTPVSCYTGYGGYTTCSGGQTMGGQTYGGNVVTSEFSCAATCMMVRWLVPTSQNSRLNQVIDRCQNRVASGFCRAFECRLNL